MNQPQPSLKKTATTAPTPPQWLRLAEYGDWPHSRGLQRFTPQAAATMVRYFKSLRGRLARKFGGLPVYIGHPDDAHFSGHTGHTDTRAYAWVTDLDARSDGLYGAFKWSAAGEELLGNAFYKFLSPRWAMESLGKDTFAPVRLLSVGLTNQPNIPGDAIANSTAISHAPGTSTDTGNTCTHLPAATVPPATATPDTLAPQLPEADNPPNHYNRSCLCEALGISTDIDPIEAIAELREQSDRFYRIACEQSDARVRDNASLANHRREHIDLVVQNAVLSGRIAPHQSEQWQHDLEADWDSAHAQLNAHTPQLKTTAVANTRAMRQVSRTPADFVARVQTHAHEHGQTFAQAWSSLKREQPDLFHQFFDGEG